ncbi:hypothetical protein TH53_18390 [Pedobacter lusitanus]|uniref:Uncharacterized protein n=1 Tax=Pedobacter lusitanus TaxID=1503925 RepID=A0A0D0GN77_9SPHI|nr:hypothetical protein [Pedobacter lusitanus]KIO75856.1 hypothetical protein TH53_18390 [Pedobacter lusitanus]
MFIGRIAGIATVIILTGLLNQVNAQDFKPERSGSIRLSESFVRAESDFSRLTVLGYRHQITEKIKLGGDFGYQGGTCLATRVNEFTLAASTDFDYSTGRVIELYGTMSAGYRIVTGKPEYAALYQNRDGKGTNRFIYQINPIAMRVGNGRISGFAELGWGYRGLGTIGIACRI